MKVLASGGSVVWIDVKKYPQGGMDAFSIGVGRSQTKESLPCWVN